MKKFNFLILMMFFTFVSDSFGMNESFSEGSLVPTVSKTRDMCPIHIINKNFRQLPNDGDQVNVLVVTSKDTIRDIVPLPEINKDYTFHIESQCIGRDLNIQLGQIDYGHEGIHGDIHAMRVFNRSTHFSDSFTITIEGFYDFSCEFILTSKCEGSLLKSARCWILDLILNVSAIKGDLSEEKFTLFGKNLAVLSDVLHKSYPPIQIKRDNLYIERSSLESASQKMIEKHGTYQAWLNG